MEENIELIISNIAWAFKPDTDLNDVKRALREIIENDNKRNS